MGSYIEKLEERLREKGFAGRLLMLTSAGGVTDAQHMAENPIHSINSGPAAAPVAGRHFAQLDARSDTAIVTDAGYDHDVSLIRHGVLPWTRETQVGEPHQYFMTGLPSVDVRSIGAGGGSIASVDEHGLLHVGPESAGAEPGPACYGRGGSQSTVTDACVALGYIDPGFFLGGAMTLDAELAERAVAQHVATPLGLSIPTAAAAIVELACERMSNLIEELTLAQGIDTREAPVIAGGGGCGLYAVAMARRIGSPYVVIPPLAATLSAAGALMSDLRDHYAKTTFAVTGNLDFVAVNETLEELERAAEAFADGPGAGARETTISFSVEARYPFQVWEIPLPLRTNRIRTQDDVAQIREDFHALHQESLRSRTPRPRSSS